MSVYFAKWDDIPSLVIDARDEAHATEIATKVADGQPPTSVHELPVGLLVAEVVENPDDNSTVLEPFPHVADALDALDGVDEPVCGDEADGDDGEKLSCELEPDHEGEHKATTHDGCEATWSSEAASAH